MNNTTNSKLFSNNQSLNGKEMFDGDTLFL